MLDIHCKAFKAILLIFRIGDVEETLSRRDLALQAPEKPEYHSQLMIGLRRKVLHELQEHNSKTMLEILAMA